MAPMQTDDPEIIKNLMLIWLTITTQAGENGGLLLTSLTGTSPAAVAARANVGKLLKADPTVVETFVIGATEDPEVLAGVKSIQSLFHTLVKASGGPGYEGPLCPKHLAPIVALLPKNAPMVPAVTTRRKKITMATLAAQTRRTERATRPTAVKKSAAVKKAPVKKTPAKKTLPAK